MESKDSRAWMMEQLKTQVLIRGILTWHDFHLDVLMLDEKHGPRLFYARDVGKSCDAMDHGKRLEIEVVEGDAVEIEDRIEHIFRYWNQWEGFISPKQAVIRKHSLVKGNRHDTFLAPANQVSLQACIRMAAQIPYIGGNHLLLKWRLEGWIEEQNKSWRQLVG